MTHSLLILGTVALTLVCLSLGAEFKGNETLPAGNRPKMESTSGKKTKGEMLDDGVTGRLESENGQKVTLLYPSYGHLVYMKNF